ncbi:DMT family transporter [Zobellia sp. 1_MG-2023]|uniref:DMT family transporter n=1 Tax=Zobellia sp. 1_MG-2023 TaxID=3062626 RepID=UPI0026E45D32|nr:DMT family transporter [Zobellia sp. 1_MG-2023]MDO6820706.1 DMT family transporter [Zobellia sp. 1_MG-2023]
MNQTGLSLLAVLGGVFLAAQGGFNSNLAVLLKNPLLASVAAFFSSTIFAVAFVLLSSKSSANWTEVKQIPLYLWFTGGLFSVMGISLYYYTIPKLGISTMISLGLFGQLAFSIVAGHFGWLNLPVEPITFKKGAGFVILISGIILINIK